MTFKEWYRKSNLKVLINGVLGLFGYFTAWIFYSITAVLCFPIWLYIGPDYKEDNTHPYFERGQLRWAWRPVFAHPTRGKFQIYWLRWVRAYGSPYTSYYWYEPAESPNKRG